MMHKTGKTLYREIKKFQKTKKYHIDTVELKECRL